MPNLEQFDAWLNDEGPVALVLREHLLPVEGRDGVLFPATFAASEDGTFRGGYNIDSFEGGNICLIDSVGSQANRIEPVFLKEGYTGLVPQIVVKAGERRVNLLEAGHRAGDAIVRCTPLREEIRSAFRNVLMGDAEPLAKIAPTSLVFGVWDSRDSQAKLPRLLASTIRAYAVRKLTRSAQYVPAVDYVNAGFLDEPVEKTTEKTYGKRGFTHVPASGTHGGVLADGGIRRDATLHLVALRLLSTRDRERKLALHRYVLGLALVGFTLPASSYLRQGCSLVLDPEKPRELSEVHGDGERRPVRLDHPSALEYARLAAQAFGPGEDREVDFDREAAKRDLAEASGDGGDTGAAPRKRGGKRKTV